MTLQNANPKFDAGAGEEVATCRRSTFRLNPEATAFVPPACVLAQPSVPLPVHSFMNEDGPQSLCGDMVPTADISLSNSMKDANNDMHSTVCNDLQTNAMTEGQMADAAAPLEMTEGQQAPVEDVQDGEKAPPTLEAVSAEFHELSKEKILEMVLEQVPFFFSRENWSSDPYLLSQMDSDQYVPIHVLASCAQFKSISRNHYSIMDALKQSELVQLDLEKHRIRPNYKRCIVILREIPESTPPNEIEELFDHKDCPKAVNCEFINNDSWYVTFDNNDEAQKAYRHLREVVKTFKDKPIAARIKTKPLMRQNCFNVLPAQPKQPTPQPTNGNGQAAVATNAVTQPSVPASYMNSPRGLFYQAANTPYNYFPGVTPQVQPTAPAYFYPSPLMQWPPTNGNFYDMNSFLHFNGLSPKATFKPATGARFPANAVNPNNIGKGTKKWDRAEPRSQSVNSNAASASRSSVGPRTSTTSTNSFSSANPQMALGHVRNESGFSSQNAYVQNDVSSLSTQAMYASFSPPVSTDIDSERTNEVSSMVSSEYSASFMQTTAYDASSTAAHVTYNAGLTTFGPIVYRNGFANEHRQQQRSNGGSRRRPRRDDEQNMNGRGSYQRGYNGEGGSRTFQDRRKPQFNLQATSFPPLPGSDEVVAETVVAEEPVEQVPSTAWNVDTQKFSDVMKGTGKSKSDKVDAPTTTSTATGNKPTPSEQTDNTSQEISKQNKAAIVTEAKSDETSPEQPQPIKSVPQPAPKEQRINRPEKRRDTVNPSVQRVKKEAAKFTGGNKENRPNAAARPNIKEEGWNNKAKAPRSIVPSEKSPPAGDASQRHPTLKNAKPLTNGDVSPPPGISRLENEVVKGKVEKTQSGGKKLAEKEVNDVTQANVATHQTNSMSWAKMAKSGKDEMEKLSAVLKEQEERVRKNRSGGRPQAKTQEKAAPKESKPFRRDPKVTEAAKPATAGPKVKEFRPKSPKAQ